MGLLTAAATIRPRSTSATEIASSSMPRTNWSVPSIGRPPDALASQPRGVVGGLFGQPAGLWHEARQLGVKEVVHCAVGRGDGRAVRFGLRHDGGGGRTLDDRPGRSNDFDQGLRSCAAVIRCAGVPAGLIVVRFLAEQERRHVVQTLRASPSAGPETFARTMRVSRSIPYSSPARFVAS
jgi:hypothetical protein